MVVVKNQSISVRYTKNDVKILNEFINGSQVEFKSLNGLIHDLTFIGLKFQKLKERTKDKAFCDEIESRLDIQLRTPSIKEQIEKMDITLVEKLLLEIVDIKEKKFNELIK